MVRFALVLTTLVGLIYWYAALRLADSWLARFLLALPFLCVWALPILYWSRLRAKETWADRALHFLAYLSMGWLSCLIVLSLVRDVTEIIAGWLGADGVVTALEAHGALGVVALAAMGMGLGALIAMRGPKVREVTIPIETLPEELDGYKIVQISDLHIGPTIGRSYVSRMVETANELAPDLIVLTGDIIDGPVAELKEHATPLAALRSAAPRLMVLGNHEYYAGIDAWLPEFERLGLELLVNEHVIVEKNGAALLVGGVTDPAAAIRPGSPLPDPARAMAEPRPAQFQFSAPALRILLAHNPKQAARADEAGFDLMLSGHTHGGQFYPWTLVTRLVHAPHFVGLSRRRAMWVYVSAGTGTWGPPMRLGTTPELTLLVLTRDKPL